MSLKRLDNGEIQFAEAKWNPNDTIDCVVEIEETGELVGFTATPFDPEPYGRELFKMLSTKYVTQVVACTDQERYDDAASDVKHQRAIELRNTDWIANSDVQLENHLEWLQYRQDLRDITSQPGYPFDVQFPERPASTASTPVDARITYAGGNN